MARKSALKYVIEAQKKMKRIVTPKRGKDGYQQPPYLKQKETRGKTDDKGDKRYRVEYDSTNRFSDTIISRSEYDDARRKYDVVILRWTPGNTPKSTGKETYYISGKKHHLVQNVASEYADEVHEQRDYVQVVGNRVRPYNIITQAEAIGSSVLMLKLIPETAIDRYTFDTYKQLNKLKK